MSTSVEWKYSCIKKHCVKSEQSELQSLPEYRNNKLQYTTSKCLLLKTKVFYVARSVIGTNERQVVQLLF